MRRNPALIGFSLLPLLLLGGTAFALAEFGIEGMGVVSTKASERTVMVDDVALTGLEEARQGRHPPLGPDRLTAQQLGHNRSLLSGIIFGRPISKRHLSQWMQKLLRLRKSLFGQI